MIFTLYLHISIVCLFLYMFYFAMVKCHVGKEIDTWQQLKDMQNSIDQLDEKAQRFMNNLFNSCVNNPSNICILTIILSFTPLIHMIVLFSIFKSIIEKLN